MAGLSKSKIQRLKVLLKLSINRLNLLHSKKQSLAQKQKVDIAKLLEIHKIESAKIRTEGLVQEDVMVEVMESLAMYCDVMLNRIGMLELPGHECDSSIQECVHTLIFASFRLSNQCKELTEITAILQQKFGKPFVEAVQMNRLGLVNQRVWRGLRTGVVDSRLIIEYLKEIAKAYDIKLEEGELDEPSVLERSEAAAATAGKVLVETEVSYSFPDTTNSGQFYPTNYPATYPTGMTAAKTYQPPTGAAPPVKSSSLETIQIPRLPGDDAEDSMMPALPKTNNDTGSTDNFPKMPPNVASTNTDENTGTDFPSIPDNKVGKGKESSDDDDDETPDFDDLAKRFERLKRKP